MADKLHFDVADESQNLLMPQGSGGNIDSRAAAYMRDVVFKFLLKQTQPNMICAVTDSSLVLAWLSIAKRPLNNVCAMASCIPLYLPDTFRRDHMEAMWHGVVQQVGQRPEELREICPRRPACLVMMLENYRGQKDPAAFASHWVYEKLVAEVRPVRSLYVLSACSVTKHQHLSGLVAGLRTGPSIGATCNVQYVSSRQTTTPAGPCLAGWSPNVHCQIMLALAGDTVVAATPTGLAHMQQVT